MSPPKNNSLPKSYYEKGNDLLAAALQIKERDVRKDAVRAALRYYDADLKQDRDLVIVISVLYILVICTVVFAFLKLDFWKAVALVTCAYSFVSLLIGAYLRSRGYISESSLVGIWREGFKVLGKLKDPSSNSSPD
jgi:hypothetical protein